MRLRIGRLVLCALVIGLTTSCSVNVLQNFADQNTNEALFADAKKLINAGDYDSALTKFNAMTGTYQTDRQILLWKASAHAGNCGFRFLTFVQDFGNLGTTRLLPFLVKEFKGGSPARIDSCLAGEHVLESIGALADRTTDENLLLALISFAKMGNVLNLYTDADQDGAADATVDACQDTRTPRATVPVAGNFFDADLREFGTGLTLAMQNLQAVASTVNFGAGSFDSVTALCAQTPSNFCTKTDPTTFTATDLKGLQSIIKEGQAVGLGVNGCTGDITVCNCP